MVTAQRFRRPRDFRSFPHHIIQVALGALRLPGMHQRPDAVSKLLNCRSSCSRCSLPSRTVRARLRILNWISYESRNVTMNVPTAARAARASKTFDISDTSKGKHRPRAGIRRCDSTARDGGALALGDGLGTGFPSGTDSEPGSTGPILFSAAGVYNKCTITSLIIYVL